MMQLLRDRARVKQYLGIFILMVVVRLAFAFHIGILNNYHLQRDSQTLVIFSEQALSGDFNFDYGRFIASPLYPVFVAIHKLLLQDFWKWGLVFSQMLLSGISGIFIFRISLLLFNTERPAWFAVVMYALFPMTFWYVHTFCQEMLFQSMLIFSIYYLLLATERHSWKPLLYSAIFFSLAYLTKSHILLFSVFIPFILLANYSSRLKALQHGLIYAVVCLLFSLPYGIYHKIHNDVYVLSSNGLGYQFYLGNTNAGYTAIVDVPGKDDPEFRMIRNITWTAGYFNGDEARYDSIMALPQNIKQDAFLAEAFDWLENHPGKMIRLKLYNIFYFLYPGISYRHYEFGKWIFSFMLSVPLYLLAYPGIVICLRMNSRQHLWILLLFLSMLIFSVMFYVQNRFRTITLEPFYIVYAGFALHYLLQKLNSLGNQERL